MTLLEMDCIDIGYGDVSFSVTEEEKVALLCTNDAGKTTVLKTICGLC